MVDIKYYSEIFEETEDLEIIDRQVESLLEEKDLETDVWYRFKLKGNDKKFRITITEDYSPKFDMGNYEVRISEKQPLKIGEGWTNWMKVDQNKYENLRDSSYKEIFLRDMYSELSVIESELDQEELTSF